MSTETNPAASAESRLTATPAKGSRWPKWLNPKIAIGIIVAFVLGFVASTFRGPPFVASMQSQVLIKGVDLDQSLAIAEREMEKTGFASVLTIWGVRDQVFTEAQAQKVSSLYSRHIDAFMDYFRLWHLTWAVSNIYRNGNAEVRAQLELAYQDAMKRAKAAGGFADAHVNGKIVMGDIHPPARLFVRAHVVAPGNPDSCVLATFNRAPPTERSRTRQLMVDRPLLKTMVAPFNARCRGSARGVSPGGCDIAFVPCRSREERTLLRSHAVPASERRPKQLTLSSRVKVSRSVHLSTENTARVKLLEQLILS